MSLGLEIYETFPIVGSITNNVLNITSMTGTAGVGTSNYYIKYGAQVYNTTGTLLCSINGFQVPSTTAGTGRLGNYPVTTVANQVAATYNIRQTALSLVDRLTRVIKFYSVTVPAGSQLKVLTSADIPELASISDDGTWGIFTNTNNLSANIIYNNTSATVVIYGAADTALNTAVSGTLYIVRF